jgi:ERO1-like protein alpha
MHASINIHLSAKYYFSKHGPFQQAKWQHNLKEFQRRFDASTTNDEGPGWLKNLYTLYLLMLRAIVKAGPYLENEQFYTGIEEDDIAVKQLVLRIIESAKSCPGTFNESDMFRGQSANLKVEYIHVYACLLSLLAV